MAAAWPYFAHFALVLTPAWPSEAPAWPCFVYFAHAWHHVALLFFASCLGPCVSFCGAPCFAYFEPCLGPCVAFCGPAWPYFALFASCLGPCVAVAPCGSCLLCFRLWLLGPCGTCLGPCMAFFGPHVAILCLSLLPLFAPTLCRLRVAFALSVLGPSQSSAAPRGMVGPAWPYLAYLASCLGPVMAFCGLLVASLRGPSVGITCFAVFHTCATLGLARSPMVWPVSWLHLVSGRLEPQASAGQGARAWPR